MESGVLKFPTIIILLSISPFSSVNVCLIYLGALMLGAYIFVIIISFWWIDLLSLHNTLPCLLMDRTTKQKIDKETDNNTINQMDPTDTHRTFHLTAAEYTFFSSAQRSFIDHGRSKNKCFFGKIIPNHNGMKVEINSKRQTEKFTSMWELNSKLLKHHKVKEEIKKEIRKYFELNENENMASEFVTGC